ncbi:MAG: prepilin peptidase [candidate division WOR-3 bacterium]
MAVFNKIFAFVIGLVFGSFFNVLIYRTPRGISIIKPSSFCPFCQKKIKFYDNIPLISFLLLGGKCRCCKRSISFRYPIVELLTGFIFLFSYERHNFSFKTILLIFLFSALLIIFFIDWEFQIIPDWLNYPGILFGFLFNIDKFPLFSLYGIVVGAGFLFLLRLIWLLLRKKEAIGGGDIKMAGFLGSYFGYKNVLFIIFCGAILGLVVSLFLLILKKRSIKDYIPFGSFLAVSTVLNFLFGEYLFYWYINLFKR